jgi:hypothetical protein
MDRLRWLKAGGWALAFLILGVVAVCPLSDAGTGNQTPTASENNPAMVAGEGSASDQDWDWEWQEDQNPSMVGRPTYLR